MVKRFIIAIVLLGIVGGGLVGFNLFRDNMIAQIFANMPQQPATVSTVEARPVTWTPSIEAIGTVNAAQGVDLTVETAGVVKEIAFAPNTQVQAGALLMRLDDVVQKADVEAARTQADLEKGNLARAQDLTRRGVTTNVSLDQTQAAAQAAEAQLARALAVLEQRQLSAPFAGTIGLPRVDVGQYVAPGTIVATLQDLSTMRVDFSLPEQDLPKLTIGQRIEVRIEGLDESFPGALTGIDPRVDPATRLVALRGSIANAGGKLTPGQFVRIRVELPAEEGVIALPQTALSTSLYGDYVYVVRPSEADAEQLEVRQVFVTPGRRSGGVVEIAEGVAPGDQIVTAGQNRLSNGQPAIVDNSVNPAATATGDAIGGGDE
ncbi:efflux RND transporter periplasmic adaptor subunit [Rhodobacteraceae bacterium HSP-20]|uniref:Efflux RND transporter periplasmic adaptor subunit n=1 Tax=Paragemmobacter amnigenus TaxID=2852097 RepID=A0ABS6JAN5_9RHOB|nr:efflux RND transporter periplasmic adaptor subunit [Rhodobacter amnigenus]MBU9699959.1 efflux RND transporter periplasmic adaptor subunit [Rhodobacter amnigenus]MBV4391186.1 efflux RND transporter periplasmic adaptor subunit [Rhodobacter amnigenus]